jgi:hypothetical protein
MKTDPGTDGAQVEYAVSDLTVGEFDPDSGRTNSNGEDEGVFKAKEEETVRLYVESGGDGDIIKIEVNNVIFRFVVFEDQNDDDTLKTIATDGTVETRVDENNEDIRTTGAVTRFDGKDRVIPFVNDDEQLRYVDTQTNAKETVLGNDMAGERSVATGTVDGTRYIYYADKSSGSPQTGR